MCILLDEKSENLKTPVWYMIPTMTFWKEQNCRDLLKRSEVVRRLG